VKGMICGAESPSRANGYAVSYYLFAPASRRGIPGWPFLGELFLPQDPVRFCSWEPFCGSEEDNRCRNVRPSADTRFEENAT
jgi:hypothetical protein